MLLRKSSVGLCALDSVSCMIQYQAATNSMTVVRATNCFLIGFLANSKAGIHTLYYFILSQKPTIRKGIGPRREPTTVALLNELVVKSPSKYLCLSPRGSAVLSLHQRSFCLQWVTLIQRFLTGKRAENEWLVSA